VHLSIRTKVVAAAGGAGLVAAIMLVSAPRPGDGFIVPIHRQITYSGLAEPGQNASFLRRAVLEDIYDEHAQVD
jgi:hypothetical protein